MAPRDGIQTLDRMQSVTKPSSCPAFDALFAHAPLTQTCLSASKGLPVLFFARHVSPTFLNFFSRNFSLYKIKVSVRLVLAPFDFSF